MKLGISGSRDIGDFDFREYFLLKNLNFRKFANTLGKESITAIITGGARGIDTIAENAANMLQISTIVFHPDFEKFHGKLRFAAFLARNEEILCNCDALLAVWNGNKNSHGTLYTINSAIEDKKPVFLIIVNNNMVQFQGIQNELIDYPNRKRWNKV